MRLSQFSTSDGTKNWGIDTSTVAGYNQLLTAYGDYVYCQGSVEGAVQKRNRVDGSLVWQKDFILRGSSVGQIMVDNQQNLYTIDEGVVYKYDSDGNLTWSYDTEDSEPNYLYLRDISADGTRILVCRLGSVIAGHYGKMYVLTSAGALYWSISPEEYVTFDPAKFDSNKDIVAYISGGYMRKYSGTDGTQIWEKTSGTLEYIAIDISDNIWTMSAASSGNITKLGKNTGNTLLQSADTFTRAAGDYWYLFPVSNGNIAFVRYDVSETGIIIDIRDSNAIQQETETHENITAFNSAVITV